MEIWLLVQLRLVSCLWLYKPVELGLTAWVKLDCEVTLGGDERECDVISFFFFFLQMEDLKKFYPSFWKQSSSSRSSLHSICEHKLVRGTARFLLSPM